MFTGLVEAVGELRSVQKRSGGYRLEVDIGRLAGGTELGDSIAVAGPCLTVSDLKATVGTFDVVSETASRTTIPTWKSGRRVHLERSLPAGGRMGGHFVTGHIDGVSRVLRLSKAGDGLEADFSIPSGCERLVAEKGSVCLDGTSLTVARLLTEDSFRVALVPHTLGATTFEGLSAGTEVNFEADILARYAARLLGRDMDGGLTEAKLRQAGFM